MSTIKISELTPFIILNGNTSNVSLVGTDTETGVSGRYTATVLANGLYANNALNVGNNAILFPGTIGQFASNNESYLQLNLQNLNGNGSGDLVATADIGTDTTYYIDVGYLGSTYDNTDANNSLGTAANPLDGYIYVQGGTNPQGGNVIFGTTKTGKEIRFIVGGVNSQNVQAKLSEAGFTLTHKPLFFADGTSQNTSYIGAATAANTPSYVANSAAIYANGSFNQANAAFNVANNTVGVDATQNTNIQIAWNTANTALQNTTGTFAGNLTIMGKSNVYQQMLIANSTYDYTNTALVRIIGSNGAMVQPPANPGYMLQITGIDGVASRVVNSSYGSGAYALFAGRKGNGTAASPTAVANNDVIARFSGSGYNGSAFTATGQGRIDIVADEDFTTANNGSRIEFYNTIPQTNTVTKIATFNANTAQFSGAIKPTKGFIYTPNVTGTTTTKTIDFTSDNLLKFDVNDNATITLTNYVAGKVVDVWITNSAAQNKNITHGCMANNSTTKSTTFTIQSQSCARLKYFSIDGDNANTFVSITA